MNSRSSRSWTGIVAICVGVAVLAAASASVMVIAFGGSMAGPWRGPVGSQCDVPELPGSVVDVALADAGTMMGSGPIMVSVRAEPQVIATGTISFLVRNRGQLVHELTVMPVTASGPGSRRTDSDGTVSEDGALGHAESACASGEGDGIPPGSASWLTLKLTPGQYELICNEPWHYRNGMYDVLTVT